jgi:hypothetical protein
MFGRSRHPPPIVRQTTRGAHRVITRFAERGRATVPRGCYTLLQFGLLALGSRGGGH